MSNGWLVSSIIVGLVVTVVGNELGPWLARLGVSMARIADGMVPNHQKDFYGFEAVVHDRWEESRKGLRSNLGVFLFGLAHVLWHGPRAWCRERRGTVTRSAFGAVLFILGTGALASSVASIGRGMDTVVHAGAQRESLRHLQTQMHALYTEARLLGVFEEYVTSTSGQPFEPSGPSIDGKSDVAKLDMLTEKAVDSNLKHEASSKALVASSIQMVGVGLSLLLFGAALSRRQEPDLLWAVIFRRTLGDLMLMPMAVMFLFCFIGVAVAVAWNVPWQRGAIPTVGTAILLVTTVLALRASRRVVERAVRPVLPTA